MKTPIEIFLVTGGFFVLVVRGWVRRFTAGTGFGIPPGCLCAFTFRVWFICLQPQKGVPDLGVQFRGNAGGVGVFGREPVKIIQWDFFAGGGRWRRHGPPNGALRSGLVEKIQYQWFKTEMRK